MYRQKTADLYKANDTEKKKWKRKKKTYTARKV